MVWFSDDDLRRAPIRLRRLDLNVRLAEMAAISETGTLNAGTWVTLPSQIPAGSSSSAIEDLLEISPGKGANSITFDTPTSNLGVPESGATTSNGALQFQLLSPQPIDPAAFLQTPH